MLSRAEMHYVVEFPLPDEEHRERLWRGMLPKQVPLRDDVDLQFIARQFPITGGDICNVALDGAFLAAQDGKVITMKHLIQALARQTLKTDAFHRQPTSSSITS